MQIKFVLMGFFPMLAAHALLYENVGLVDRGKNCVNYQAKMGIKEG